MWLRFTAGAMPQLHSLQLDFMADTTKSEYPKFDFGIQHLCCLTQVVVKINCSKSRVLDVEQVEDAIRGQLCQNPNNPKSELIRDKFDSFVKDQVQGKDVSQLNRRATLTSLYFDTAADMVCASTGAMNSVLRKLAVLIGDDYAKKLGAKHEEVMRLHEELGAMNALLEQLADMPELNMEMKVLRSQMRNMTYDVEDCIDGLVLQFDQEKWDVMQDFIHEIRNLTAQAGKADLPSTVHTSEIQTLLPSYKATESGLHTHYNKAIGIVGIDGPRDLLVKRMNAGKRKRRLVACILGSAGLGKTTLATEVYNHIKGSFHLRVFIQVPQTMDITEIHKLILRKLVVGSYYQDMDSLVENVKSYLRDKRYLIVIDGVRTTETWGVLESVLPENNRGSRIIMTTDKKDIAELWQKHSSHFIYCMEPLNRLDSFSLFRGLLFGSRKSGPMELERVAKEIVKACDGIPMAISIMAGILAGIPADVAEWEMVEKRMEPVAAGDGDHAKKIIRKLFDISYSGLPRDIRCCLLYLRVFPDKHFIEKDCLIWRWIAEGFLPKTSEESPWETGERYFQELIARNLIEPVYEKKDQKNTDDYDLPVHRLDDYKKEDDYEVRVGCKVHGLILEFITSLSNEENLVTTMAEATDGRHGMIRRLIVSNMDQEKIENVSRLIKTKRLSKVRSITILGRDERVDAPLLRWKPLLLASRFLRVLDLEDARDLRDMHLMGTIEGLVLLRYLRLAGTGISELPENIGKVEQLETLDLRRNYDLKTLPASIASLQKLVRLLVDPWVHLPSEISKMQELEQVSTIDADSSSSLNSVAELLVKKSKPLRMLDVNFGKLLFGRDEEMTETCRESIISFLRVVGDSNLQSLSLDCGNGGKELAGILLDSWEVPPRHLRRFKLKFILSGTIPPQMASLVSVTHLDIRITELEPGGIRVLGDLPNLVLLKLEAKMSTRFVISGEKAFECLKVFTLRCFGGMGLELTPGAMPQLQSLRLHFKAQETLSRYGGFDFGIQHLSCLSRLHATIDCYNATVSEVEGAEAAIRRQVSDFPIKPATEFSRENETTKTSPRQKVKMMLSWVRMDR